MGFKDKFINFQTLDVNENLTLRQVDQIKDLEVYFQIYNNADVFRYYGGGGNGKASYESVKKILANQRNEFEKARVYTWTIAYKNGNQVLGRIHLSNFEANNKIANIGYFIDKKYWGKGIISACIKPVIEFGFSNLKLERIYTRVHVDNVASWKALENNGFTREGLLRHCFETPSSLSDCYIYSKLYTE